MLLEVDESALEWRVAAELSRDTTMVNDIINGVDPHTKTLNVIFGGNAERVLAKVVNFRQIFQDERNKGYGYFKDSTMPKYSRKRWDGIVDGFYTLYSGFSNWHNTLVRTVNRSGEYVGVTGRRWVFKRSHGRYGYEYDRGKIYNYCVQGTSADVVKLYMCDVMQQLQELKDVKLINCVHDSLIFDLPKRDVDRVVEVCYTVGNNQHNRMREVFGCDWVVPLGVEVKTGKTWGEMETIKERANV